MASVRTGQAPASIRPWWLTVVVLVGAVGLTSLAVGGVIAPRTLVPPGDAVTDATRIWARYAAGFSVSLAAALVYLLVRGGGRALAAVLAQAALVQLLLGVVAVVDQRWFQVPLNALLLAAFAISGRHLYRHVPRVG